jgi:hypothetical protein
MNVDIVYDIEVVPGFAGLSDRRQKRMSLKIGQRLLVRVSDEGPGSPVHRR